MSIWLLLNFLFSLNSADACQTNNPNSQLSSSLSISSQLNGFISDSNIDTFNQSQACDCHPERKTTIPLPELISYKAQGNISEELSKLPAKVQAQFASANLRLCDDQGYCHTCALTITDNGLSFASSKVSFLIKTDPKNIQPGCENIKTEAEEKLTTDCHNKIKALQNASQNDEIDKTMSLCNGRISQLREKEKVRRNELIKTCEKNSRKMQSFTDYHQAIIEKSQAPTSSSEDSTSEDDPLQNVQLTLGIGSENQVTTKSLLFYSRSKLGFSGRGEVSYKTDLGACADKINSCFNVTNKAAARLDGKVKNKLTLSASTGTDNTLLSFSTRVKTDNENGTSISTTFEGSHEGKTLILDGFYTLAKGGPDFGLSGRNKNTNTEYSVRKIEDAVHASAIRNINTPLGKASFSTTLTSIKEKDRDRKASITFGIFGKF